MHIDSEQAQQLIDADGLAEGASFASVYKLNDGRHFAVLDGEQPPYEVITGALVWQRGQEHRLTLHDEPLPAPVTAQGSQPEQPPASRGFVAGMAAMVRKLSWKKKA
jgi:hypothetical protein